MKKIILTFLIAVFILSCSGGGDDSGGSTNTASNYMPLNQGNVWVYKTRDSIDNKQVTGTQSMSLGAPVTIEGKQKYPVIVNSGKFLGFLDDVYIYKEGSQLMLDGEYMTGAELGNTEIEIKGLPLYDTSSTTQKQLGTLSIQDTLKNAGDYPIIITTSVTSTQKNRSSSLTLESGKVYNDIIPTEVSIEMQADVLLNGSFPTGIPGINITIVNERYAVMDKQKVGELRPNYAANIGLIQNNTRISTKNLVLKKSIVVRGQNIPIDNQTTPLEQQLNAAPPLVRYQELDQYTIQP